MSEADGTDGSASPVRVGVLGPVAVHRDGSWVEPAGRRAKALLVALVLASPRAASAEQLIDDLWGDEPPRSARGALQALVSRLRAASGEGLIESTPTGYRLAVPPSGTDLGAATALAADAAEALEQGAVAADDPATSPVPADAARLAHDGLALWRGTVGADLDPGPLTDALVERADHLVSSLELTAATAALRLGAPADAEAFARRLHARSPFDDHAVLLLMRALADEGRPTEAVALYAEFRERVQDTLGTSPSRELQTLNVELLERALDDAPAADAATPRAVSSENRTHRPPPAPVAQSRGIRASPNALIGRDDAVLEVRELLGRARVTTILGAGGLGKTRLAHEVAAQSLGGFESVIVVELAGVRSADDVVFALASGLGIREIATSRRLGDQVLRSDLRTRILNRLDGRRTLVVVDNCEHLIDAAARWIADLTGELPLLTVLATSRTPLALSSERVYALRPLGRRHPVDMGAEATGGAGDDDPAVRLFIDRASAARPGAALPRDVIARLCERLDGLPLAIELAAARIRSMSVEEIERRLGNRFALLTGGDRSAPERHRTLLAVIEWSWNLLGSEEQRALALLSDFADGFSGDAARSVVGPTVDDALDALIAQSLVSVSETPSGLRFRMLETVREFGRLRLDHDGLLPEVQERLFAWADGFAAEWLPRLSGAGQTDAFDRVAVDEDNLVDVLRRAVEVGRPDVVVSVFGLLAWYWSLRSAHSEVMAFGKPVFESIRRYDPPAARAASTVLSLVLIAATMLIVELRFGVLPLARLRRVRSAAPPLEPRLEAMCDILLSTGSMHELARTVERLGSSTDRHTAMLASIVGGVVAENAGRRDEAVASARRAVSLAESLHDTWGEAMAAQMLGQLYSQSADAVEALHWSRRAKAGMTRIGAVEDLRQLEWVIAANAIAVGDIDEASELFERLVLSPGETDGVAVASIGLAGRAEVLRARGLLDAAAEADRAALASFDVPLTRSSPWFRLILSAVLTSFVADGTATPTETRRLARRLRSRVLASLRPAGAYVDRPVFGASLVGLAAWVDDSALGLQLATAAEAFGARQDIPGLRLAPLFDRFAAELGEDAVASARASVAALPDDERPERVAALLRTPGPWSWAWRD